MAAALGEPHGLRITLILPAGSPHASRARDDADGQASAAAAEETPDLWRLHKDLEPGRCIECGEPPAASRHLPGIDGKHRRETNYDDSLVPADGRWYRYECPAQHWWISAPVFKTVPPIIF
jgi:hypothetical protein